MSARRACEPCRAAKARCDLERPTCGRCQRRGVPCYGYASDADFIFRNENVIAQRNSERARRESAGRAGGSVVFALPGPSIQPRRSPPRGQLVDLSGVLTEEDAPWLNAQALATVPRAPMPPLDDRVIDRFFTDWILCPGIGGTIPGHMHDLPALYLSAPADSVLPLAVKAVAYANMRDYRDGDTPFYIKARSNYGAALTRMRTVVADEQKVANNRVLAALLLIDDFELIHLHRGEPLGPHTDAVKHMLLARGNGQLYDKTSFALWRVAHHRLQSRQILLHQSPDPAQIEWMSKLNVSRPDIHVSADVLHMNMLNATAHKLLQEPVQMMHIDERVEEVERLLGMTDELLTNIESWAATMGGVWQPREVDANILMRPYDVSDQDLPMPASHTALLYQNLWVAYMWNFHRATQITLRESVISLIQYLVNLPRTMPVEMTEPQAQVIEHQKRTIDTLSELIMKSFPALLGFTDGTWPTNNCPSLGKMVGRFFALFSMWMVQRAQYTSAEHKRIATRVIEWIGNAYKI